MGNGEVLSSPVFPTIPSLDAPPFELAQDETTEPSYHAKTEDKDGAKGEIEASCAEEKADKEHGRNSS